MSEGLSIRDAARRLPEFTLADLVDLTGLTRHAALGWIKQLRREGQVERCGTRGQAHVWRLTEAGRAAAEAPDASADAAMWTALRRLGALTPREMVAHVSTNARPVTEREAKAFCARLLAAGYLRVVEMANPGAGREARYALIRNTGPLPPQSRRITVTWDPNRSEWHGLPGRRK